MSILSALSSSAWAFLGTVLLVTGSAVGAVLTYKASRSTTKAKAQIATAKADVDKKVSELDSVRAVITQLTEFSGWQANTILKLRGQVDDLMQRHADCEAKQTICEEERRALEQRIARLEAQRR